MESVSEGTGISISPRYRVDLGRPARRTLPEPVAWVLVFVWTFTLALWNYYVGLWFYSANAWDGNALTAASVVLRTRLPLWCACFLPAATVGLAGYGFIRRPVPRGPWPAWRSRTGLSSMQAYGMLCTAICVFCLISRILPIMPLVTNGEGRSSLLLRGFNWDWNRVEWGPTQIVEQEALIGALAFVVVATQVWGLLAGSWIRRRRFFVLVTSLVVSGVVAIPSGLVDLLPSPAEPGLFALDRSDPAYRGLLFGDSNHRAAGAVLLARYFETHDARGRVLSQRHLRKNLPFEPYDEDECHSQTCQVCRLPGVGFWTTTGVALSLAEATAEEPPSPAAVVEIPRGAHEGRIYERGDPPTLVVPIHDVAQEVRGSSRIVLKVDFAVRMPVVLGLLEALRDYEVRGVDLAVMPHGFDALPTSRPRLTLNEASGLLPYRPVRNGEHEEPGIVVKKYFPPPDDPCPEPKRCFEVDSWDYREAWLGYRLEPAGSLPAGVTIAVHSKMKYGTFVGLLQGAVSGGASTIDVTLQPGEDQATRNVD